MVQSRPVPQGAWDTHHHIFEPKKYPLNAGRHFTPGTATPDDLDTFEKSIGVQNTCIAHGLSYGPDCTSLLDYLDHFKGRSRGICVIEPDAITDDELDKYHAAGIRSVRLDFFKHQAMDDLEKQKSLITKTAERIRKWGWSVQIQQPHLEFWAELRRLANEVKVPIVVDHMGLISVRSLSGRDMTDTEQQGLNELHGAMADGNVWVKISAPYRCSDEKPGYADLEDVVRGFLRANKERVVWGSDWPHTQRHKDRIGKDPSKPEEFQKIDNQAWIESLSRWCSEDEWTRLWVANPEELYK